MIRIGSPVIDQTLSARPVARRLSSMEMKPLPLAVLGVPREMEFGLAFYRNQTISRYEMSGVPQGEHLLVTPAGARDVVAKFVGHRRVSFLGDFAAQNLDFYWIGK
ncbi:MAG: hypothetical protein DMG81_06045 [Acidobacteria bacterium]|nr:MAG: hypothetical protein DMG81_06045 [Acidobacteriota bacterium]